MEHCSSDLWVSISGCVCWWCYVFFAGYFYHETRRAVNALVYMDQTYEIFQALCRPRKYPPKEPVFKMREFLFLLKVLSEQWYWLLPVILQHEWWWWPFLLNVMNHKWRRGLLIILVWTVLLITTGECTSVWMVSVTFTGDFMAWTVLRTFMDACTVWMYYVNSISNRCR